MVHEAFPSLSNYVTTPTTLNYVHGHMFAEPQDLVSHRLKRPATVEQKLNNVT